MKPWTVEYVLHGIEHSMKVSASTYEEAEVKAHVVIQGWLNEGYRIVEISQPEKQTRRTQPIFADRD